MCIRSGPRRQPAFAQDVRTSQVLLAGIDDDATQSNLEKGRQPIEITRETHRRETERVTGDDSPMTLWYGTGTPEVPGKNTADCHVMMGRSRRQQQRQCQSGDEEIVTNTDCAEPGYDQK